MSFANGDSGVSTSLPSITVTFNKPPTFAPGYYFAGLYWTDLSLVDHLIEWYASSYGDAQASIGTGPGQYQIVGNSIIHWIGETLPSDVLVEFFVDASNLNGGQPGLAPRLGYDTSYAFTTGTNVTLVGKKGPNLGKLTVQIDTGTAVTVDCYWPVDLLRAELYQVNGLSASAHTVKATIATKNAASSGNAIGFDYFVQSPGSPAGGPLVANVDNPAGASVVYTGAGWTHATGDTVRYAGTRSYSATVGDYVEFTFTGTGARIWGAKAATQGKLSVTIDGGPATVVNCYQPTVSDSLLCTYEVNGLTAGTHTLRATIATKDAASSGNNVTVDLFQVLTGGAAYPLTPVTVDNPAGAAVAYTGAWTHSADVNYYNSTKSVSNTLGNYVTFTFTGTGASLYAKKDASLGKLDVQIDGGTATSVDCYATNPSYQVKVFEVSGLPPGTHTLRATVAAKNPSSSGNFIGVDYFKYQP